MNIIKMYMNNVIILVLAVRICEDSDTRGSDKRGYTVFILTRTIQHFFYGLSLSQLKLVGIPGAEFNMININFS